MTNKEPELRIYRLGYRYIQQTVQAGTAKLVAPLHLGQGVNYSMTARAQQSNTEEG